MKFAFTALFLSTFCCYGKDFPSNQPYISIFDHKPLYASDTPFPFVNPSAPQGGELIQGAVGSFDSFYPFFLKGQPCEGLSMLYATLFKGAAMDPLSSYPYAAERVTVTPQEITFFLRPDMVFHDGSPLTAEDVAFSFSFLIKNTPVYKDYYQAITGVNVKSSLEVSFYVKDKAPEETALILSQLPILSKKFMTSHDVEKKPLTLPLGSGPYRIAHFKPGKYVHYEKVPGWWGQKIPANQGFYNFQSLKYEYFRDYYVLFEAFKKGDVHVFIERIAKNWEKGYDFSAVHSGLIKKETVPYEGSVGSMAFIFNMRKPLFKDKEVRKALSLLLSFDKINKVLFFNSYRRTTSLFQNTVCQVKEPPSQKEISIFNALPSPVVSFDEWSLDPFSRISSSLEVRKEALALMEKAGWHLRNGSLTHPQKGVFQFSFLTQSSDYSKLLQIFKLDLASIGITMNIKIIDSSQYTSHLRSFDFDMVLGFLSPPIGCPGNELINFLGSRAATLPGSHNLSGLQDPSVDFLIEKILKSSSYEELVTHSLVLDRLVMALYPGIPGWHPYGQHLAYWDRFGKPQREQGVDLHTWWNALPPSDTSKGASSDTYKTFQQ